MSSPTTRLSRGSRFRRRARAGGGPRTIATIEPTLSALAWIFAQTSLPFDRKDRHVSNVLAGVRRTNARPPVQKEALLPEHVLAMLDAPPPIEFTKLARPNDLAPGLRRRSAPLGNRRRRHEPEGLVRGLGWPEFFDDGVLLTLRGKTCWREVEIGRGSPERICPVAALETWLKFACIAEGRCSERWLDGRSDPNKSRPPRRAPHQAPPGRGRRARRSFRTRATREIRGTFASRRLGLFGRARQTLRPEAPQPSFGENDTRLPASARPLPGEPDQGRGSLKPSSRRLSGSTRQADMRPGV